MEARPDRPCGQDLGSYLKDVGILVLPLPPRVRASSGNRRHPGVLVEKCYDALSTLGKVGEVGAFVPLVPRKDGTGLGSNTDPGSGGTLDPAPRSCCNDGEACSTLSHSH